MPQAASAHDTFWDFISWIPESMHMIMWVMSDRAIPRSLRMMEGFGVHTFRFINEEGKSRFVKFHWKPLLGVHLVVWDERRKFPEKTRTFTGAICGKPSKMAISRNGNWGSSRKRTSTSSTSICSMPQN